jgi:peptidoglycan/LPS O-acetylase OafA/YrhL
MSDGPFRSRAPKMGFVAPFDGVRGFGVIIVVLEHGADGKLAGVASIVDLFFIISGFLITTLLLEEYRGTGRLNLREFYLRRAVRLFPVLYALAGARVRRRDARG